MTATPATATPSGGDVIVCEGLVRIHRTAGVEVQALQGLDLRVQERAMLAVVGASGSGKSTLLGILAGLDTPSAGRAVVGTARRCAPHDAIRRVRTGLSAVPRTMGT